MVSKIFKFFGFKIEVNFSHLFLKDQFFLIHKRRCDALFYTFFLLGTKIVISIYLGIGQYILDAYGGYKNNICAIDQPETVATVLRHLFIPVPLAMSIISSIFVYFYPITDLTVKKNTIQLKTIENRKISNERSNPEFNDDYEKKAYPEDKKF